MIREPWIDHLVADAGAFLRNIPLHHMARKVLTVPEVVSEIRDKATRDRLQVLPYELELKDPSDGCIRQVSDFARKSGELRFLSATDVRVLALTLQMTREEVGGGHIRLQPTAARAVTKYYHPREHKHGQLPVGFVDKVGELSVSEEDSGEAADKAAGEPAESAAEGEGSGAEKGGVEAPAAGGGGQGAGEETGEAEVDDGHGEKMFDAREAPEEDDTDGEDVAEQGDSEEGEAEEDQGEEGEGEGSVGEEDEDDDDDGGWITPANVQAAKKQMNSLPGEVDEPVKVACMTTDFTMQNVMKQMNLEMVSVEGRRIREVRRFVLRCFGCFKVTPQMDKAFCLGCGNKTLKRVAVTLKADGSQQIHISTRKPLSKRGTKFSLPLPRGGKYSVQPVLCGDQPLPQQRATARSKISNAILSDDFVQGGSPFSQNDVNSRAAQLGRNSRFRQVPNWERHNPNARAPPTGNKKKRKK